MPYSRAHIRLNTAAEANDFVSKLNADGTIDKYIIEDTMGAHRADARSILGVIYALSDFNDEMYLVNTSRDGIYPSFVDNYRV